MPTVKHQSGFTLVEILIVVAIIGLLAVIALPNFAKARRQAQNTRFISDLRVASHAYDLYAQMNGDYPPDTMPTVIPAGMSDYLAKMHWTGNTPIGGHWDWDFLQYQFGCRAGVSVYLPDRSDAEMALVDARIDDGNLAAGQFRKRAAGYIYFNEE
ncbi:MAG: type II secretion system protein [Verrucomicrobia bacterium]|nr:type II secretion system protein [Verrucomicrobiota bacterium]